MEPSSGSEGNPSTLSPLVFWAQTESSISLRVSLQNVSEPDINATTSSMEFSAHSTGENAGKNDYYFKLVFIKDIDPNVRVSMKEMEIEILIEKKEREWWPRLVKDSNKPAWLKIDFNQLKNFYYEEKNVASKIYDPSETSAKIKSRKKKYQERSGNFRKMYLFLYNLSQFIGFLYVLIMLNVHYVKEGPAFMGKAYPVVQSVYTFCQLIQLLEIVHPLLGYTAGGALIPLVQIAGRLFFLFVMIDAEPRMQSKPVVFCLLYAYSLAESIRYPYYMLRVYNTGIGFLTWLRYTIWMVLYPIGFLCEGLIVFWNIPYFKETEKFSLLLPNRWNISFYLPSFLLFYLVLCLFPLLYVALTHMYGQRVKILGRGRRSKEE